jgi:hypothetical protein
LRAFFWLVLLPAISAGMLLVWLIPAYARLAVRD